MSKRAEMIDAAHKLFRESIGTAAEEEAYAVLVGVVRHAQDNPISCVCSGSCDGGPDAVMQHIEQPDTENVPRRTPHGVNQE